MSDFQAELGPLGLAHDAVGAVSTLVTYGPELGEAAAPGPRGRMGDQGPVGAVVGGEVLAELAVLARLLAPAAAVAAGSSSPEVAHHARALGAALDAHRAALDR